MKNLVLKFGFYMIQGQFDFLSSELIDIVLVIFDNIVFVIFVVDTLPMTQLISSNTISQLSAIPFKCLLFSEMYVLGFQLYFLHAYHFYNYIFISHFWSELYIASWSFHVKSHEIHLPMFLLHLFWLSNQIL